VAADQADVEDLVHARGMRLVPIFCLGGIGACCILVLLIQAVLGLAASFDEDVSLQHALAGNTERCASDAH
jgi:hypothetical protein